MSQADCHPDRPVKARGLCGSCYNMAHERGQIDVADDYHYGEALIEEIEFMESIDWFELERMFNRSKTAMYRNLYNKGKTRLIEKVNRTHKHRHG